MAGKTPQELIRDKLRSKLTIMRQEVIRSQRNICKEISGPERRLDGADAPFQDNCSGVHLSRISGDRTRLKNIERALQLINNGKYGICQTCQQQITLARLEDLPFATHCTTCESEIEKSGTKPRKP